MRALENFGPGRRRGLWVVAATLVAAAVFGVAFGEACVTPPITTTATPGGSANQPGAAQHDTVTVGTSATPAAGTVKFFLCTPTQVTANGGNCSASGTLVGSAVTLDSKGNGTSATVNGSSTPNDNAPGKYCWRAEFTPGKYEKHYLAGSHTNSDTECFTIVATTWITTTPSPKSVTLGTSASTLKDTAVLSGGSAPTGKITFTLVYKGSTVDTETVTVSGNGSYTTPTGYTLPSSGTVTGTYQWNASYSGDGNNNAVSESNAVSEQVAVNPAPASVVTTASGPATLPGAVTFTDSAVVSGGYHPTGTLTFTLTGPNGFSYTQKDTVSGNGTYTATDGPITNPAAGTYTWTATYAGDANNSMATDQGGSAEQTVVSNASPSIVTTPSPKSVTLGTSASTLKDTAVLSGGSAPTGKITFTLVYKGSTVDTETVTVSGNGSYTTPTGYTLPSSGTVTGTYQWNASYSGDGNNNAVSESNAVSEQVTVNPASPAITTTPSETTGSVDDVLNDTAHLSDGSQFDGSGTITFNLYGPSDPNCSGTPAYTETVSADHNGDYTTSNTQLAADSPGTWNWTAAFSGDSNNTQAVSGCGAESMVIGEASIHILKTADSPQVTAGDPIGFTMTVWNDGSGNAKGVTLTDVLPTNPGLHWIVGSQGAGWAGSCAIGAGELTCGPVTVPAGTSSAASTFTVHITSVTTAATGGDCEETGSVDNTGSVIASNAGSDQSSASTCVTSPAIHVLKTADAAEVKLGGQIGFTMTVWNTGNGDAKDATLTDALPATPGLSWKIDKQGAGWDSSCSIAAGVLSCGPVTVPAGTTQAGSTLTVHIVSATAAPAGGDCPTSGAVENTAKVATGNGGSDQSTASTCVQALVDLSVTKSGSPTTQTLGGNITWTIVVTNNGPDAATGVKITDPMPGGNAFVSATTTQGTCTGGAVLSCAIGDMAADAKVTITLVTTPSVAGPQTNTVTVSGNRPETNTGNNTATSTVQVTGLTPPTVFCVAVSRVTPRQLFVGRKTMLTIHVTQGGKVLKGIHVRIKGPKVNVKTKASNSKGVIKHKITIKKAGVLIFTPIADKHCNTKRVGVTNVFTPPVTG